jgi:hypothetical protein
MNEAVLGAEESFFFIFRLVPYKTQKQGKK